MAYNTNAPVFDRAFPGGQLVDISTASISYAPIPFSGVIVGAFSSISAAITTADGVVTVKVIKDGTTSTIGTITVTQSGSAPGDVDSMVISGSEITRTVKAGDTIVFDSSGACDTTSIANFTGVVRGN
jgi:hypothetical protein